MRAALAVVLLAWHVCELGIYLHCYCTWRGWRSHVRSVQLIYRSNRLHEFKLKMLC